MVCYEQQLTTTAATTAPTTVPTTATTATTTTTTTTATTAAVKGNATNVAEAAFLEEHGADAIIAQGSDGRELC